MSNIILHGGGEHASVVLDGLLDANESVLAIFDPKHKGQLMGVPQLGAYDETLYKEAYAIVAVGDNAVRRKAVSVTKHRFTNFVHKSAIVSKTVKMGVGNMIMQGSIVQVNTEIGNHVILNTGCRVDHDCTIADYVHVAPGAVLCGTVSVGEGAFVGANAVIIPGVKVGEWSRIGAGAVVVRDVPANSTVAGNPARALSSAS